MKTQAPVTNTNEPLVAAQQKMLKSRSHTLLVQNSEHDLVGLLTVDDINEACRLLAISPALVSGSKLPRIIGDLIMEFTKDTRVADILTEYGDIAEVMECLMSSG